MKQFILVLIFAWLSGCSLIATFDQKAQQDPPDADGDADGDSDGDGDGDSDGDVDGDSDGDTDGDSDGDADGDSDGDADGDSDGDADGDGDGDCRLPAGDIDCDLTPARIAALEAGANHTCALMSNGSVYCWGANNEGQAGDTVASRPEYLMNPRLVELEEDCTYALAAGVQHTCALSSAGNITCWGNDDANQLGDGLTTSLTPHVEQVDVDACFIGLAAGSDHTCAWTSSGEAWCWGTITNGVLGPYSTVSRGNPVEVPLPGNVVAMALGTTHSCALDDAGEVFCWGRGAEGQLGQALEGGDSSSDPLEVYLDEHIVTSITAGAQHNCVITREQQIFCWGNNTAEGNELLLGGETPHPESIHIDGVSDFGFPRVIESRNRSTHVVVSEVESSSFGWVINWGLNEDAELGRGDGDSPGTIGLFDSVIEVSGVTAGFHHACAWEFTEAICWGANDSYQLGDRTQTPRLSPVTIEIIPDVS